MHVQRLFPMLSVADLIRSVQFYGDVLGGREAYRFPEKGDPVFITLNLGSSEIGLGAIGEDARGLHGELLRPATGHRVELCIYVDEVDAAVERVRAAGFTVVLEPRDQPWGERLAYVKDPDGNLLMLTGSATPT